MKTFVTMLEGTKINSIHIEDFDTRIGKGVLRIKFNEDINIITGVNGSGKTLIIEQLHEYLNRNRIKFYNVRNGYNMTLSSHCYIPISNDDMKLIHNTIIELFHSDGCSDISENSSRYKRMRDLFTDLIYNEIDILLYDYIEEDLYIDIQLNYLNAIRKIRPNIQIICTTQSPAVIMNSCIDNSFNLESCLIKSE
jgi:predicted ATP-binding protein involved in virulence